jgi:hypothetical protein
VAPAVYGLHIAWADTANGLDQARALGPVMLRLSLVWKNVEPQPGAYNWSYLDQQLQNMRAAGITTPPVMTIRDAPAWAVPSDSLGPITCGPVLPDQLPRLAQSLETIARRYAQTYGVHHWEIYNEPDNTDSLYRRDLGGCFGNAPEAYVALLQAFSQALRRADPEAVVWMGGLAMDWFTDDELYPTNPGPFRRDFLDRVLALGGAAFVDAIAFHYYPLFRPRWEPWGPDIQGKARYIQSRMAASGVSKPLVCTESGAWSGPYSNGGADWQANYVLPLYSRAQAVGLSTVIWFNLKDIWGSGPALEGHGLLDSTGTPKLAYSAYQTMLAQVGGASGLRPLTAAERGTDLVEGYEYQFADGRRIWALWTSPPDYQSYRPFTGVDPTGPEVTIAVPQPPEAALDALGRPIALAPGQTSVMVKPRPRYLRWGALSLPSPTATPAPTATPPVPTATLTPTVTPWPTPTPTLSPTPPATPTPTGPVVPGSPMPSPSPTLTATPVPSPTVISSPIPTATAAWTPLPSATAVPRPDPTPAMTATPPAPTATLTPTVTPWPTPTPTPSGPPPTPTPFVGVFDPLPGVVWTIPVPGTAHRLEMPALVATDGQGHGRTVVLTVSAAPPPTGLGGGRSLAALALELTTEEGQPIRWLAQPLTLVFAYGTLLSDPTRTSPTLRVYTTAPVGNGWERLPTSLDPARQEIRATTTHLSLFVLVTVPPERLWFLPWVGRGP